MRIRHLVAAENVDAEGFVIDPHGVRHGLIVGGQIAGLAGPVEPLTHLNLDFADHRLDACLVVERLEQGAPALRDGDFFQTAVVRPGHCTRLGAVPGARRRDQWQLAFERARRARA